MVDAMHVMPLAHVMPPARARGRTYDVLVGDTIGLEMPGTSYANVDQLNTQIVQFARAIVAACGGDPLILPNSESADDIKAAHDRLKGHFNDAVVSSHDAIKRAGALGVFWYDEVSPFLSEWQTFHQDHSHWYDLTKQLVTGSEVYQTYQKRLDALRERALKLGLAAEKLPTSQSISKDEGLFDKIEHALGKVGTTVAVAALGIGAAFAIAEIAKR
jgi:hypothetical protein